MSLLPPAKRKWFFYLCHQFYILKKKNVTKFLDEIIESWILFGSPLPWIYIMATYFSLLYFLPMFMKNRPPYNLTKLIRCYNVFQIVACTTFAYIAQFKFGYNIVKTIWKCEHNEQYATTAQDYYYIFAINWYFLLLRAVELFETIFFILRKKQEQVTNLHVYHHVSTLFFVYICVRYSVCEYTT